MKTPKLLIPILAATAILSTATLSAATTDPVGYVTVTVAGGQSTFLSLPLQGPVAGVANSTGSLTGVGASTLTNTGASWTANVFAGATPHYVRITSGTSSGLLFKITANASDTLTLDTDGLDLTTSGIASSDGYEIFQGDTLRAAFGDDSNGIVGGASPSDPVDKVFVLSDGAWSSYYYNTTASQWREGVIPFSRDNIAISPGSAVLFSRAGVSDLEYVFTGRVPVTDFLAPTNPNGFTACSSYFPVAQTLAGLNLQTLTWWQSVGDPGVTVANADKVFFFNSGVWAAYHYDTAAGQWREGFIPFDRGTTPLGESAGFLISRDGAPSVEQVAVDIPYTL